MLRVDERASVSSTDVLNGSALLHRFCRCTCCSTSPQVILQMTKVRISVVIVLNVGTRLRRRAFDPFLNLIVSK